MPLRNMLSNVIEILNCSLRDENFFTGIWFYIKKVTVISLHYFRQHYKYEDITPARREFLEKQDENMTQKRQEADLSYWAQVISPYIGQKCPPVWPRYDFICFRLQHRQQLPSFKKRIVAVVSSKLPRGSKSPPPLHPMKIHAKKWVTDKCPIFCSASSNIFHALDNTSYISFIF